MHPALVRYLIYPLQERALRRPTFNYLRELEASQWLDRAGVEALQLRKLAALLRACADHPTWHRGRIAAAGLEVGEGAPPLAMNDLRSLPLMDKADASANRERIVWRGVPGGAVRYTTGGSRGTPLIFYFVRDRQASAPSGVMRARYMKKIPTTLPSNRRPRTTASCAYMRCVP